MAKFSGLLLISYIFTTAIVAEGKYHNDDSDEFYDSAFAASESSGMTEQHSKPGEWEEQDILSVFPELQELDNIGPQKSLQKLQEANKYYKYALQELDKAKQESNQRMQDESPKVTKYEWEKQEWENQLQAEKKRIEAGGRNKAIGYLVQSMKSLDMVKNPRIQASEQAVDLSSKVYRDYVKLQFRSRNLGPCIEILERYIQLKPDHQKEAEPYRLLAACYRHQEMLAEKMKSKTSLLYKEKKNSNLLKYAELSYPRDSAQYREIIRQIQSDNVELYSP